MTTPNDRVIEAARACMPGFYWVQNLSGFGVTIARKDNDGYWKVFDAREAWRDAADHGCPFLNIIGRTGLDAAPDDDGGWRPLDDNAKNADCEWLLGTTESDFRVVAFWDAEKDDFNWQTADGPGYRDGAFTHYRPLPTPPSPESRK